MAKITHKGNPINTAGDLPAIGSKAPNFVLVRKDLSEAKLEDYIGKKIVLNIFPSLDTSVCALSVKQFYKQLQSEPDTVVLNISCDLPFAHARFCQAEGITSAETLSAFRGSFGEDYRVRIVDGFLKGLLSRAVLVLDRNGSVVYSEQVPEIGQEPNYGSAFEAVKSIK